MGASIHTVASGARLAWGRFNDDEDVCAEPAAVNFIELVRVPRDAGETTTEKTFKTSSTLSQFLADHKDSQYPLQILFIHQRNSWAPLQVSKDMIAALGDHYQPMAGFYDVLRSFRDRVLPTEEAFCGPVRMQSSSGRFEISYVQKYTEAKKEAKIKTSGNPWVIRQLGIYHLFDMEKRKSTVIVLSHSSQCLFERHLKASLKIPAERCLLVENPLLVHASLFSACLPSWREYLMYHEEDLLEISNTATAAKLDEPLRIRFDTLKTIRSLQSRFLPLESILKSALESLDLLSTLNAEIEKAMTQRQSDCVELQMSFEELKRETVAYRDNALFMVSKTHTTGQSISDTLNIKFQSTSEEQSGSMCTLAEAAQDDSVAIRVITLVTLFYLPFSFIATVMGMNLLVFDTASRNLLVSDQLWLYFVISLPLTALTLAFWRWKIWRHKKFRQRILGKGQKSSSISEMV